MPTFIMNCDSCSNTCNYTPRCSAVDEQICTPRWKKNNIRHVSRKICSLKSRQRTSIWVLGQNIARSSLKDREGGGGRASDSRRWRRGGWKKEQQQGKGSKKEEKEEDGENEIMRRWLNKSRDRLQNNAGDIRRGESEDSHFFSPPFCHFLGRRAAVIVPAWLYHFVLNLPLSLCPI